MRRVVANWWRRDLEFALAHCTSNADARHFRRSIVVLFKGHALARFQSLFSPQKCQETRWAIYSYSLFNRSWCVGLFGGKNVKYQVESVLRMTLGLRAAAPLPIRTISHMAGAELTRPHNVQKTSCNLTPLCYVAINLILVFLTACHQSALSQMLHTRIEGLNIASYR